MLNLILKRCLGFGLLSLLSLLVACVQINSAKIEKSKEILTKEVAQQRSSELPFALEVLDEVNDGKKLHLRGSVMAKHSWDLEKVVVRLLGLHNGSPVELSHFILAEQDLEGLDLKAGRDKWIYPDQKITFFISIPSGRITDYQLELLWGRDAQPFLKKKTKEAFLALEIKDLQIKSTSTNCSQGTCPASYSIEGNLFNSGTKVVKKALLGVGFKWVEKGNAITTANEVPENEEQVELKELELHPGDLQPIRLVIDKSIPTSAKGEYKPIIRVISLG